MKRGPYLNRKEKYEQARKLRLTGLGYRLIAKEIYGINWTTIKNWVQDIKIDSKIAHRKASDLLFKELKNLQSKEAIRQFLIRKRGNRCEKCTLTTWLDKKIILEVNHKDGNKHNNEELNLELLCPNCHSFTPTWRRTSRLGETVDTLVLETSVPKKT